jgi:hypothetical protein
MSKVFGIHMVALLPGANADAFETYVRDELNPVLNQEGWHSYLLKGDRGDREGKYLWMIEFDSVEVRDRLFPAPGVMSKEAQQAFEGYTAIFEKWTTFATPMDTITTDYVVVS